MAIKHAVAASLWAACAAASADVGYYVVTAYDNAGKTAVDFRYWTVKLPGRKETVWPELGLSWGVNSRWTTEVLASWIGSRSGPLTVDTLNWQNDILLTQGEWPFDLALHSNLAKAHDTSEGWNLELGPAVQTDFGRLQVNGNIFIERKFRAAEPSPTQLNYQWQLRYRWMPALHFGAQGFGELGAWNHWAPQAYQSHRAGPAVFGRLGAADTAALTWQAAYLKGSVYTVRKASMFTARLLYAF